MPLRRSHGPHGGLASTWRGPWDDDAPTLSEAKLDFHRADIEAADAALDERKRQAESDPRRREAPEPKEPPPDPATERFLDDEADLDLMDGP